MYKLAKMLKKRDKKDKTLAKSKKAEDGYEAKRGKQPELINDQRGI